MKKTVARVPNDQTLSRDPTVEAASDPEENYVPPAVGKARAEILLLDEPVPAEHTSASSSPSRTVQRAAYGTPASSATRLGPPRVTPATTQDENGLRWQRAFVVEERLGGLDVVSSPAVVPATAISGGDDGPQLMAPGIPVETDPFADPFGDRQLSAVPPATRQADLVAPLEVPGEQVASPIEETLDAGQQAPLRLEAIPLRAAQAAPAGPGSPDSNRNHETSAQELGSALQVPGSRQSQQPPSTPMPRTPASERHIYNERDCDRDVADCQRLRDRVRARSIRQISLDISPSFNPVTLESGEAPPERPRGYVNDYRTWTDAQGRVVAVGALQGIEHGRLLIRTREGKIEQIPYRELSDVDQCYFAAWWGIPSECTLGYERYEPRQPVPATFAWKASAVYHKPLYFEEVQLERYGHSARPLIQTALSGAHFVGNIATLPYQMAIHPMWECQYPLGHYRPGNCAPWLVPPVPVSAKGGLAEAGVILGGVFLVP